MWETSDLFSPLFFLSKLPPSENAEKKNRRISSVFKNLELKMHAKNTHARARAHARARTNFQAHFDQETEDTCARVITKLSHFSCSFVYFLTRQPPYLCSLQKKGDKMTERKSSRKTLTPKRFIPEETEKKDKDSSGGQKSGGSKVSLIS